MGAVRMIGVAEIRRRWRSVVVLTLLVGFVGAVVLALTAGARRTDSSLRRFEQWSRSAHLEVDVGDATPAQLEEFRHSPGVVAVGRLYQLSMSDANGRYAAAAAQVGDEFGRVVDRARVIAGREADPRKVDEVTIGEALAAKLHLDVGDHLTYSSSSPAQTKALSEGGAFTKPDGPVVTFRVVGIVRRPLDLGGLGAKGGVVVPTPAFLEAYRGRIGTFVGTLLRVRTERGAADAPRVGKAARRIFADAPFFQVLSVNTEGEGAQDAIDVTTSALFIAAAVAGLAGLVGLGITLAREISLADAAQSSLRALGMRPRHRIAAAAAIGVPIGLGGAVLALLDSVFASSLFPIGVGARAEPNPGIRIDALVAAVGFAAVVIVVATIVVVAAARTARAFEHARAVARPTAAARAASALAVSPTMGVGVRFALDRGKGRRALPVRSSLAGVAFGVVIVVAVSVFSTSLDHLASTPREYGWTWDLASGDGSVDSHTVECGPIPTRLTRARSVAAMASICTITVEVEGHPITAFGFRDIRGHIEPKVVEGRSPTAGGEIALGTRTLAIVHRDIGDRVRVAGPRGTQSYRIVGRVALPTISVEEAEPLADGAALTGDALARLDDPDGFGQWSIAVRFAPNADRAAATKEIRSLVGRGGPPPVAATLPVEIDRVRQIDGLPIALGAFVAVVAMAAVGYALVTAARRRRRDLAILKTLGFTRAQVRAAMAWHATTVSVIGLVVGIPLGLVLGRFVWKWVADGFGVSPDPTWPVIALLVLVPVALIVVNVVAAIPARTAARTRPAVVLRSE